MVMWVIRNKIPYSIKLFIAQTSLIRLAYVSESQKNVKKKPIEETGRRNITKLVMLIAYPQFFIWDFDNWLAIVSTEISAAVWIFVKVLTWIEVASEAPRIIAVPILTPSKRLMPRYTQRTMNIQRKATVSLFNSQRPQVMLFSPSSLYCSQASSGGSPQG